MVRHKFDPHILALDEFDYKSGRAFMMFTVRILQANAMPVAQI